MIIDAEVGKTLVFISMAVVSISLLVGSRHQPFPEISRRFGWLLATITAFSVLGESAPRPMELTVLLGVVLAMGSYGVLVGVHHMVRTRRDVFIAPMSGFLFCIGAGGLMVLTWPDLNQLEQWSGFLALVVLGGGQTWMVFRGLLIGRLPLAWSQAGMVALQRGQLDGPQGAIACFEKGWDADEEHLNPMAYIALASIYRFNGDAKQADTWQESFVDAGGRPSVATAWILALNEAFRAMGGSEELFPSGLDDSE